MTTNPNPVTPEPPALIPSTGWPVRWSVAEETSAAITNTFVHVAWVEWDGAYFLKAQLVADPAKVSTVGPFTVDGTMLGAVHVTRPGCPAWVLRPAGQDSARGIGNKLARAALEALTMEADTPEEEPDPEAPRPTRRQAVKTNYEAHPWWTVLQHVNALHEAGHVTYDLGRKGETPDECIARWLREHASVNAAWEASRSASGPEAIRAATEAVAQLDPALWGDVGKHFTEHEAEALGTLLRSVGLHSAADGLLTGARDTTRP